VKLLIDTHIALWGIAEPTRVPAWARQWLESGEHEPFLSDCSVWEVSIKHALGKLDVTPERFVELAEKQGYLDLPISRRHLLDVSRLAHVHRDPFDRLLVAQARAEGMTLLTADRRLAGYGDFVRVAE
jgi:PIN domain nuclease of toxin-antitoxin system